MTTWPKMGVPAAVLIFLAACTSAPQTAPPGGHAATPSPTTTGAAPASSSPSHSDATFTVGSAPGDPSRTVDCSAVDFPFVINQASADIHWTATPGDGATGITADPAQGDLTPGGQQTVHITGTSTGGSGSTFTVTVASPQNPVVSYTITLTCQ